MSRFIFFFFFIFILTPSVLFTLGPPSLSFSLFLLLSHTLSLPFLSLPLYDGSLENRTTGTYFFARQVPILHLLSVSVGGKVLAHLYLIRLGVTKRDNFNLFIFIVFFCIVMNTCLALCTQGPLCREKEIDMIDR